MKLESDTDYTSLMICKNCKHMFIDKYLNVACRLKPKNPNNEVNTLTSYCQLWEQNKEEI